MPLADHLRMRLHRITLLVFSFFLLSHCAQPGENGMTGGSGSSSPATSDLIRVTSPEPLSVVESPLTITGEARGTWYFEASFPVRLVDANGTQLAIAPAQAQGEWMTTEFVPFSLTLPFDAPTTDTGMLILEKDNPSGLPEHAASVSVPVRFR